MRRNKSRLGICCCRLRSPLRVVTLSDAAFKAQDYQGLVMRGCVIVLAELGATDSTPRGVACLMPGQEVRCQVLDWYARKQSRVVRSTYAAELLSLLDAVGQGNLIATALGEISSGAETALEMLARHAKRQRPMEHDACVDAKAVYEKVTAECRNTPADKPLF